MIKMIMTFDTWVVVSGFLCLKKSTMIQTSLFFDGFSHSFTAHQQSNFPGNSVIKTNMLSNMYSLHSVIDVVSITNNQDYHNIPKM